MATTQNSDRDLPDYGPSYRDRDLGRDQEDREISLGTGTILGIFFTLALLCAAFFGFGYSMGRKSVQTAVAAATPPPAAPTGSIFSSFKPAAGSPSGSPAQATSSQAKPDLPAEAAAPHDPDGEIVTSPVTSSEDSPAPAKPAPHAAASRTPDAATAAPHPATVAPAPSAAMPAINPNGTTMVQVAAVSHQEDADTLVGALKKRGYMVFVRQEPQDHLLHVQLGPFSTHKDADLMRQRLLADGYNAIVK
jgi:cell division septation protein DedD